MDYSQTFDELSQWTPLRYRAGSDSTQWIHVTYGTFDDSRHPSFISCTSAALKTKKGCYEPEEEHVDEDQYEEESAESFCDWIDDVMNDYRSNRE